MQLTFPTGSNVALAGANGVSLRYEVRKQPDGEWHLFIDEDEKQTQARFGNVRDAKAYARQHFYNRQKTQ